jgi:hypothetical protein
MSRSAMIAGRAGLLAWFIAYALACGDDEGSRSGALDQGSEPDPDTTDSRSAGASGATRGASSAAEARTDGSEASGADAASGDGRETAMAPELDAATGDTDGGLPRRGGDAGGSEAGDAGAATETDAGDGAVGDVEASTDDVDASLMGEADGSVSGDASAPTAGTAGDAGAADGGSGGQSGSSAGAGGSGAAGAPAAGSGGSASSDGVCARMVSACGALASPDAEATACLVLGRAGVEADCERGLSECTQTCGAALCRSLGNVCHDVEETCHEIGHDGIATACFERGAECLELCREAS